MKGDESKARLEPCGIDEGPVFLVGFMGAGKTTVGRVLARQLGYDFFDLDSIIEKRAGKSIQNIFSVQGEQAFRLIESEAIRSCLGLKRTVIALGGGAYISEENRKSVSELGIAVWLDCPLGICLERVGGDKSRPLLGSETNMKELFDRRRPAYALADVVVRTGALPPERVAIKIIRLLERKSASRSLPPV